MIDDGGDSGGMEGSSISIGSISRSHSIHIFMFVQPKQKQEEEEEEEAHFHGSTWPYLSVRTNVMNGRPDKKPQSAESRHNIKQLHSRRTVCISGVFVIDHIVRM